MSNEFHLKRRMWFYYDGTLLIAPENDERSHYEWLCSVMSGNVVFGMLEFPRGYVINNHIRAYCYGETKGKEDKFHHRVDMEQMKIIVPLLINVFQLDKETLTIGFGAKPEGDCNKEWKSRYIVNHEAFIEL